MSEIPTEIRHTVQVPDAAAGDRLDKALATILPQFSRTRIKSLIQTGAVVSGGAKLTDPSMRVKPDQRIDILVPPIAPARPVAQDIALDVVYEDEHLIVIDKPAGLVVHPAHGNPDRTLVNALIAHCGESLSGVGGEARPGIVHRLDKDTSGLLVAAKNDAAHRGLAAQFADHSLDRAYKTVVWGVPRPAKGEIAGNIGRHPRNRKKMAVVQRGGKQATTRYQRIGIIGAAASLLACQLTTGRTHQIRVHLASIGHPVVGDPVYGGRQFRHRTGMTEGFSAAVAQLNRQALHAYLLGFSHPISRSPLRFESDLPSDIKRLLR